MKVCGPLVVAAGAVTLLAPAKGMALVSLRSGMSRIAIVTFIAMLMLPALPAGAQDDGGTVHVDGAVQVTSSPAASRGHTAPAIAVDPTNHQVVAIAEGDVYSGACSVHISIDGGLSWDPIPLPEVASEEPRCAFQNFGPIVDVAFDSEGALYYAFNVHDPVDERSRVYLARSTDFGTTWDTTAVPSIERDVDRGEMGLDASPSVAIDPNDPDRVHVGWGSNAGGWTLREGITEGQEYYWDILQRVHVASSTDAGQSFGDPVDVGEGLRLTEDVEGVKPPPQVLSGNDGEVYAFFGEYSRAGTRDDREGEAPPASIYMATSTDGGATYTNKAIYTQDTPTESSAWTWVPKAAIDRDNGNLYVVWEEMSHAGEPVMFAVISSTDGGETWSSPVQVNDVEPEREWNYPESFPNIAVAPNGRVDVVWYDWRDDPTFDASAEEPSNAFQDVYYSYSTDGGQSWAPNERVSDRSIDRRVGPYDTGGIRGPLAVAALDPGAYIAWDDTRAATEENQNQDIYFSRARFDEAHAFFSAPSRADARLLQAGAIGGPLLGVVGLVLFIGARLARKR